MVFLNLVLAEKDSTANIVVIVIFIVFGVINAVANAIREKKEAKDRQKRVRQPSSSSKKEGEGLGGLAELLRQLSGEESSAPPEPAKKSEKYNDYNDGYDSEYEEDSPGHTVIGSDVFDANKEALEDGHAVVSPLTLEVESRRSTEAEFDEQGRRVVAEKIRNAEVALASSYEAVRQAESDVSDVNEAELPTAKKKSSAKKQPAKKKSLAATGIKSKIAWSIILGAPTGETQESAMTPPGLRT